MILRGMIKAFVGVAVIYSLISAVYAQLDAVVVVGNTAPEIVSVKTFSSYTDDLDNVPATSFVSPSMVYIQVKARDINGFQDIQQNGFVKVKIVLWDGLSEAEFTRFGSVYVNASFESGSNDQVIYTYAFQMLDSDPERIAPLYYRVKAQVSDGEFNATSNISSEQNADYTYQVSAPPSPPPTPILFDVTIDIPENKNVVEPGDSFYATVTITKISPLGLVDIQVDYQIIDPDNETVDSLTETVAVNNTIYRVPVLYIPLDAIPGRYRFKATVLYGGVQIWSESTFTVQIPGPTTTTTTIPSTTTTTLTTTTTIIKRRHRRVEKEIPITPPLVMKKEISIYKYPYEVHAFKDESKPLLVVVKNTGYLDLNDVTVYIGGPIIIDKIVPEEIGTVEPDSRRTFIIEVRIPSNLAVGDHHLTLKAIAKHATDERYIKLVVLEKPDPDEELRRQIDGLEELVEDIWGEVLWIGVEGRNVSHVFKSLNKAKTSISKAEKYWRNKEYDKARDAIKDVKRHIEEAVTNLAMKPGKKVEIKEIVSIKEITRYVLPLVYWVFAIIALLSIILLVCDRFKRAKVGKRLEERYELRRMKDKILGK
ncbi:MAG: hypothetical protein U9Q22_08680 [Candidatus Altiarchaeota archaeon]|nr:hypothetical protein [Candidatus Altiarchaeota archaeon]